MVPGIVGLYFHLQPPTGYPLIDSDFASPLIQSAQKVWQSLTHTKVPAFLGTSC